LPGLNGGGAAAAVPPGNQATQDPPLLHYSVTCVDGPSAPGLDYFSTIIDTFAIRDPSYRRLSSAHATDAVRGTRGFIFIWLGM